MRMIDMKRRQLPTMGSDQRWWVEIWKRCSLRLWRLGRSGEDGGSLLRWDSTCASLVLRKTCHRFRYTVIFLSL